MLPELKSDRSLPDIPPPKNPVNVTGPAPENDRDPEKYYCECCEYSFFTKDGVRQHTDNVHFGEMERLFGNLADHVQDMKNSPKPPEDNTPGRKKMKQKTSMKKRNDSVGRRKRVQMSTEQEKSDSSSDFTMKRRTQSTSKIILQDTKHREEEVKNVPDRETSLEMSKEEFVKSYNLRRKDDTTKNNQKTENQKSKRKSKGDVQKEQTDGKSENTVVVKQDGAKDMEQNVNSANIVQKGASNEGDEIDVENKHAE